MLHGCQVDYLALALDGSMKAGMDGAQILPAMQAWACAWQPTIGEPAHLTHATENSPSQVRPACSACWCSHSQAALLTCCDQCLSTKRLVASCTSTKHGKLCTGASHTAS